MSASTRRSMGAAIALFVAVVRCGQPDASNIVFNLDDGYPGLTPQVSITLDSSSISLMAGAQASVKVIVVRNTGYAGPVELSVENSSAALTTRLDPATLPLGTATSTLTIGTAVTTVPGGYWLTVVARASETAATINLPVTILPSGGFTIRVIPSTVTIPQGGSLTLEVAVTRAGTFVGPVTLTFLGDSTQVSGTLSPVVVSGTSSSLFISAAPNAIVGGVWHFGVYGTAPEVASQDAMVTVIIAARR